MNRILRTFFYKLFIYDRNNVLLKKMMALTVIVSGWCILHMSARILKDGLSTRNHGCIKSYTDNKNILSNCM